MWAAALLTTGAVILFVQVVQDGPHAATGSSVRQTSAELTEEVIACHSEHTMRSS